MSTESAHLCFEFFRTVLCTTTRRPRSYLDFRRWTLNQKSETPLSVLNTAIGALNILKDVPLPVIEPAKVAFIAVSIILEIIRVLFSLIARWWLPAHIYPKTR